MEAVKVTHLERSGSEDSHGQSRCRSCSGPGGRAPGGGARAGGRREGRGGARARPLRPGALPAPPLARHLAPQRARPAQPCCTESGVAVPSPAAPGGRGPAVPRSPGGDGPPVPPAFVGRAAAAGPSVSPSAPGAWLLCVRQLLLNAEAKPVAWH